MRKEVSGYDEPGTDPVPTVDDTVDDETAAGHAVPDGAPNGARNGAFVEPGQADAMPMAGDPDAVPGRRNTMPDHADTGETGDAGTVLFGGPDVERFRDQWRELQADFVDDPITAVQGADRLVDDVMRALSETFAAHKHELEAQWQGGGTGETEELRVAMRRYRSFFDQLLSA